ncbi:hypothetical protein CRV24_000062 [Beauveria bassiana]|nr:hypothetical protein CRV24_000062 [Beauveria bassiana]KAH8721425.1 hypothetical protein HC256_001781 [Beauveria bassiana]
MNKTSRACLANDYEQKNRRNGVGDDENRQDPNSSNTNDEDSQSDDDESLMDDAGSYGSSVDAFAKFTWLEQIDATTTKGGKLQHVTQN